MFSQDEYLYGWLLYLAGALALILVGWVLTAKIRWKPLKRVIRLLGMTFLLVPWYASEELAYLAPAWIIAAFEGIFEGNFWRAGGPLLSALGVALIVGGVAVSILHFTTRKPSEPEDAHS
jgi:hypothetical protein